MPVLYIVLTIVCFVALSVFYKISQERGCDVAMFTCFLYLIGAGAMLLSLARGGGGSGVPQSLWVLATATGLASILGLVCLLQALKRGGNLGVVNALMNLSVLIPIVCGFVFLGEKLTVSKAAGIACFIVFVVLLNARKEEAAS